MSKVNNKIKNVKKLKKNSKAKIKKATNDEVSAKYICIRSVCESAKQDLARFATSLYKIQGGRMQCQIKFCNDTDIGDNVHHTTMSKTVLNLFQDVVNGPKKLFKYEQFS